MKKYCLAIAMLAAASLQPGLCQTPTPTPPPPTPSPSPLANCLHSSWNPETHIFYGEPAKIDEKLTTWCAKPSERRLMVQITQGDKPAGDVRLFERNDKGAYTGTDWSTKSAAATSLLIIAIDKAIMANHGDDCVGKKIRHILNKLGDGKPLPGFTEPSSPEEVFGPAVKESHGKFIKTVIIFGC